MIYFKITENNNNQPFQLNLTCDQGPINQSPLQPLSLKQALFVSGFID